MTNPFDLGNAVKLALIIGLVVVLAKIAATGAEGKGLLLLAGFSGIADVDAITLSMARTAGSTVPVGCAVDVILVAVGVNSIAKAAMAAIAGGRRIGLAVALPRLAGVTTLALARLF